MTQRARKHAGDAWYDENRPTFVQTEPEHVVGRLLNAASSQGWHVEEEQLTEWKSSIELLRKDLSSTLLQGVGLLRGALEDAGLTAVSDVILEYNLRRRGLRIDCVLLAPGLVCVLEFKRSPFKAADREQVLSYCISLVEFHEETRRLCEADNAVVVPILVQTRDGRGSHRDAPLAFFAAPWQSIVREPIVCDAASLKPALQFLVRQARSSTRPDRMKWLRSEFCPSSTILDAAISLYGQHEVSSIKRHESSVDRIESCIREVRESVQEAQRLRQNRIIFVSGAPGSGKTLVGLRLAFDPQLREDSVFVTGNAPLVDVLTEALRQSYKRPKGTSAIVATGYPCEVAKYVAANSTFKIVKAHHFLAERGNRTASSDGRVVVFDEAQRTYEKGRVVLGSKLADHEADLILESLERSYEPGVAVVALVGQNQSINRGERGPIAWFEAAERRGWAFSVSDATFELADFADCSRWRDHEARYRPHFGHLSESLRFYRNNAVERWAHSVLANEPEAALELAGRLAQDGHTIWISRDLAAAKTWARRERVGEATAGVVASGQARRLAAEGLFVDFKPPIAKWMLQSSTDVRSASMLETVQNQYQVQGLELDYVIACWDLDLRREQGSWKAYKLRGSGWQRDPALEIAANSYRVLLTRARRGMVIFVPRGDSSGSDDTRPADRYDAVAEYLLACGGQPL